MPLKPKQIYIVHHCNAKQKQVSEIGRTWLDKLFFPSQLSLESHCKTRWYSNAKGEMNAPTWGFSPLQHYQKIIRKQLVPRAEERYCKTKRKDQVAPSIETRQVMRCRDYQKCSTRNNLNLPSSAWISIRITGVKRESDSKVTQEWTAKEHEKATEQRCLMWTNFANCRSLVCLWPHHATDHRRSPCYAMPIHPSTEHITSPPASARPIKNKYTVQQVAVGPPLQTAAWRRATSWWRTKTANTR